MRCSPQLEWKHPFEAINFSTIRTSKKISTNSYITYLFCPYMNKSVKCSRNILMTPHFERLFYLSNDENGKIGKPSTRNNCAAIFYCPLCDINHDRKRMEPMKTNWKQDKLIGNWNRKKRFIYPDATLKMSLEFIVCGIYKNISLEYFFVHMKSNFP